MSSLVLATITTEFLKRPGYAASTLKSYELTLLPLLQEQGHLPMELLSRGVLEHYLNNLTHLSYTTHRRHQAILQSLMNFAVGQGCLKTNPIAHLQQRKPDAKQGESLTDELVRYLSPQQLEHLYQLVRVDVRLHALVALLHRSGARISEILSLDLAEIDLEGRKFQVIGKGNKKRWCFYSADAGKVLERYIHTYRRPSATALFTAQQPMTGTISRLSYTTVYKAWKK
jgi:integrase/recombinase XerD